MRKTKIICTIGPASDSYEEIKNLMLAGMNVARLNFSHDVHEKHLERINTIKKLRDELNLPVGIMLDTKGPEIRAGIFENGSVILGKGQTVTLTGKDVCGTEEVIPISYKNLDRHLNIGNIILIDDGLIALEVTDLKEDAVTCVVKNGGKLSSKKSINIPDVHIDMPYITEKDKADILFGAENDIDFIAASFVRNADDIRQLKSLLPKCDHGRIKIIAKIENREGVLNADEILSECDGIMVARGDLGVEVEYDRLPSIQKNLIKKCYAAGKIAITATQMLDSMIHNPRPTRAEVTDIANAIYDGTSAIMLSGETAAGSFPVESVKTMATIAVSTEKNINYKKRFLVREVKNHTVTDAISHAACTMAIDLNASAIVAVTQSGYTAQMVAKFRPFCPIVAAAVHKKDFYQLSLTWGTYPILNERLTSYKEIFETAVEKSKNLDFISPGDTFIVTGGSKAGVSGTTDTVRVYTI